MRDIPRIAARSNAQFRALRALARSAAGRRRQRRTLLDGPHLIAAYLARSTPALIAVAESARGEAEIEELLARSRGAPQVCIADALFGQISPVKTPTGIVAAIDIPAAPEHWSRAELVVMLEAVQDPGNVGTIIRCAAAAGAGAMLLSPQCADPWAPRTLRAAMGAHFALAIHPQCDLERAAGAFDGRVIATGAGAGVAPYRTQLNGRVAILFGAEGAGLSAALEKLAHERVSIPLARGIESLNVGAAAAVILFERVRQLAMARAPGGGAGAGERQRQ